MFNEPLAQTMMFRQFIKFSAVGVINTLVTLFTIFVCKSLLGVNPYVSNAIGYGVGLINSFVWNRRWVFDAASDGARRQIVFFLVGFAVCYVLQLIVVRSLMFTSLADVEVLIFGFTLSGYGIATIIGNVVYTITTFLFNRQVTFRR